MNWAWIVVAYFVYKIITTAIESEKVTKVAKVDADLKRDLAKRIQDPEMIERIMGARVDENGNLLNPEEMASLREAGVQVHWDSESQREDPSSTEAALGGGGGLVLAGLICFFVGLAFCGVTYFELGPKGLWIPGFICGAVGLALLTFATSQPQIKKQMGRPITGPITGPNAGPQTRAGDYASGDAAGT